MSRRGRKRKTNVIREPNGRASRSKEGREQAERVAFEQDIRQTVLKARLRHLADFEEPADAAAYRADCAAPVSKDKAKAAKLLNRGSVLADLWADGKISDQLLAAGNDYARRYVTYASLYGMPLPNPAAASYGAVRGGSRPDRIKAAVAAKQAHKADCALLKQCGAAVEWAVHRVAVLDEKAPLHLVREGLEKLAA